MKKRYLFACLTIACMLCTMRVSAQHQNLVYNGDFESYGGCPTSYAQMGPLVGWRNFTYANCDYLNCTLVPSNLYGYQHAASGTGYVGAYSFTYPTYTANTYKEYLAGTLVTPMQVGATYEVSMSVSLANTSGWGCNDFGMYFYQNGPYVYPITTKAPVTPQVTFTPLSPITDTTNWVRLTATFYADSAYDNIVVGSFLEAGFAAKGQIGITDVAYYYYDSIVVRIPPKVSMSFTDTVLCAGDFITVPYTVLQSGYFNSGNVFSLQLSDATGSFASPTVLGTQMSIFSGSISATIPGTLTPGTGYRLRIKSSNVVDSSSSSVKPISIGVVKPAKPVITSNSPVCNGQTLSLNANSATTGVNYKWTGPNGFTSAIQNPSVTNSVVATAGDYIVTAWLYGCYAKDTETVVVNNLLAPVVAGSNTPVCAGQTLNLTSTTTNAGSSYTWAGPNSYTSSQQNPSIADITAAGSGTYTVTATLNNCIVKSTVAVQVKPVPVNVSATSNSPVCTFGPLNLFGSTTTTGITYSWTGPNSFSTTLQNPTIATPVTAAGGDYILTATLNGCSIKDTTTVIVNQAPANAILASATPNPVCENTPMQLSASNTVAGTVYSWAGPAGFSSAQQNPSINAVPKSGWGDYIVTATLNGCVVKDTVIVTVFAAPTNINATSNSPLCAGQTLNLNVTNNTTGVNYSWTGPSFGSTAQNPIITAATPAATGNYIATLSINGCVLKDTVSVVVNPIPTTPTASSNTPVCKGQTLNLYAGGSLPGATYSWTGPSFTSSQQNPVINNANSNMAGQYSVVASLNGCTSAPASTSVTVTYLPSSVSVYVLPNDTICTGGSVQLIAVAINGGTAPQYQWLKNGFPISGAINISHTAAGIVNKDKFSVILTPDNACPFPDTSQPMEITVLPFVKPEVSITASPGILISPGQYVTFTATPINGGSKPTYQWKRNGQNLVGAINDTWGASTLTNNDVISVVLYSNEMCPSPATATSNEIVINLKLGVDDVNAGNDWKVYPNPNAGIFSITGNGIAAREVKLTISNALGQIVHRQATAPQNHELNTQIQLPAHLANGMYLLRIDTGTEIIPVKITLSR